MIIPLAAVREVSDSEPRIERPVFPRTTELIEEYGYSAWAVPLDSGFDDDGFDVIVLKSDGNLPGRYVARMDETIRRRVPWRDEDRQRANAAIDGDLNAMAGKTLEE